MPISTGIPESWNLPLFWATVDGSQAGNVSNAQPTLLVGQMFTSGGNSGNAALNVPVPVGSVQLAGNLFGVGSMLYRMCVAFFQSNTTQQLWGLPVPDPSASVAANGYILVTAAGGNAGTITLYIAGQVVTVGVSSTDTTTTIAANIAAAINALTSLPITATAATGLVTLTCQWPGITGNDIVIIPNYRGVANGEVYPVGTTLLFSAISLPASAAGTTAQALVTFAAGADANVVAGMIAYDTTIGVPGAASLIGTVSSIQNTTVTMAANLAHAVAQNDIIVFFSSLYGQLANGTGNPNFSTAISNLQLLSFNYVGFPYSDSGSQTSWANEFGFTSGGRWNFSRQQYGFCVNARRDTYANLLSWGITQNQPVLSTMAMEPLVASPVWEVAACYCGCAALGFSDDPARPLQTLEFIGILGATQVNRFTQTQRNNLVNSGLAIQQVNVAGNMAIMVEQTQYQFNAFSQSDTAFGKLTVLATLQTLLQNMKSAITSKYPRMKLVPTGTRLGPGQAAVTPLDIKGELIAEYALAEYNGLVADHVDFAANLIVQIDPLNPNKVQVLWPPQLAGQLRQFDVLAQFRLQYPSVTQLPNAPGFTGT